MAEQVKLFPIQRERGAAAHPLLIPWSVAEMAYSVYSAKYGTSQSLERMAERGGFAPSEMDDFYPPWREKASEVQALTRQIAEARAAVVNAELATAERIARQAHRGQKEESTGDDYILHVERVVALVEGDEAKAVAWLHDVVEDCEVFGNDPEDWLRAIGFSERVIEAVLLLTRGFHVPKSFQYEPYIDHIHASGNQLAIAVKLADLRDHLRPNCPERLRPRYERALQTLTEGRAPAEPRARVVSAPGINDDDHAAERQAYLASQTPAKPYHSDLPRRTEGDQTPDDECEDTEAEIGEPSHQRSLLLDIAGFLNLTVEGYVIPNGKAQAAELLEKIGRALKESEPKE